MLEKFAVIGGGSWGTALACLVARITNGCILHLHEDTVKEEINNKKQNSKYLGNVMLPKGIIATSNIQDVIEADIIILAVPSHGFVDILDQLKQGGLKKETILLIATKGLCETPSQLFSQTIEDKMDNSYAFISGPNFAKEVAEDKFTAITISSKELETARKVSSILVSEKLNVTTSTDITTIQIASIVKNIIAIKSGIMQANGSGENAKAWLISRGLKEIAIISAALGGSAETLSLPAVVGDLVLTCYSTTSRNTKFGYEFHQNNYSKDFLDNYPILVEGVNSSRLLKKFLQEHKLQLDLPVISSVVDICVSQ